MASFTPPAGDARPLSATDQRTASEKKAFHTRIHHSLNDTLQDRCRSVIAANLDRYPPQAIGTILAYDVEAWESIVRERNEKTKPNTGTGGLDGTGRLLPAVSDRFLAEVEKYNTLFADSAVVDRLGWKDCVEYRFRSGGLTRPAALQYPWPVLVNKLKRSGDALLELVRSSAPSDRKQELLERHTRILSESPMNVSLLQASGVGKSVRKFIKAYAKEPPCSMDVHIQRQHPSVPSSPLAQLEETLTKWKDIAAKSSAPITTRDWQGNDEDANFDDQEDLRRAESCHSWRELFSILQQREEKRRKNQGARMRKIRTNLATGRPKVIKVRPAKARHDNMLARAEKKVAATKRGYSSASFSTAPASTVNTNKKMAALKKESKVATTLQKSAARPSPSTKGNSFSSAVAFASNANSRRPKCKGQVVALGGGKRMKLPPKTKKGPPFQSRH